MEKKKKKKKIHKASQTLKLQVIYSQMVLYVIISSIVFLIFSFENNAEVSRIDYTRQNLWV